MPPAIPAAETSLLTFAQYSAVFPSAKANSIADFEAFRSACEQFDVNTPARLAAFCAQDYHESAGRTRFVENLNYSAQRLQQVWPRKFKTSMIASDYARLGPEAIANYVYAGVNGNGPQSSGDGWKYRGRGDGQLTGLSNYRLAEARTGLPVVADPDLVALPENGCLVFAAFWRENGCNELADKGDFMGITWKVNGGTIGFPQRAEQWERIKTILGVVAPPQKGPSLDRVIFNDFMHNQQKPEALQ